MGRLAVKKVVTLLPTVTKLLVYHWPNDRLKLGMRFERPTAHATEKNLPKYSPSPPGFEVCL